MNGQLHDSTPLFLGKNEDRRTGRPKSPFARGAVEVWWFIQYSDTQATYTVLEPKNILVFKQSSSLELVVYRKYNRFV